MDNLYNNISIETKSTKSVGNIIIIRCYIIIEKKRRREAVRFPLRIDERKNSLRLRYKKLFTTR